MLDPHSIPRAMTSPAALPSLKRTRGRASREESAPSPAGERPRRRSSVIARAVIQFGVPGLAALVLVGLVAMLVLRERGQAEAIRDARQLTRAVGLGMIEPRLTDDLEQGDSSAVRGLDDYVQRHVLPLDTAIVRIKMWNARQQIVYSDDPRLIGKTYPLGAKEREALVGMHTAAEVSDLGRPENRLERGNGRLLEVYLPLETPGGRPVLFEVYLRYSSVAAEARDIWLAFAPALVAALLLLWLIQLPLAWSFGRRLDRGQRERRELLEKAMAASEFERRRIAADLHDGVVQDLAGVSLTLAVAASQSKEPEAAAAMASAADQTRQSIRQMRSLLVDIYPDDLHSAGLQSALPDLMAPLTTRGLRTRATVDEDLKPPPEVEQLVFRTAKEGLRNVLLHARADEVALEATAARGVVRLVIQDDGSGFSIEECERARANGHFGLALLRDRAADLGGRIAIQTQPGCGTRLELEVPAR
jgi:two-component system, NarL family, sensor kinase